MNKKSTMIESPGNAQDVLAVQAVLEGNKNAFNHIYKKYFGHILRYMSLKLNFNNTVAEDITMDTLAKVYMNLNKYDDGKGTFNSWITNVAQNTLIDHIRAEVKHNKVDSLDSVLVDNNNDERENGVKKNLNGSGLNPEEEFILNEKKNVVHNAIRAIKNKNIRQCLVLVCLKDMSHEQVVRKTGLSLSAVKANVVRGKELISKQLGGHIYA